jgi:hypothetical protein
MAEYLNLKDAYDTLIDYNNDLLQSMKIPREAARDYNDANDGCAMRIIKTRTPVAPQEVLLRKARRSALTGSITSLLFQTRLSKAYNSECRHRRLLQVTYSLSHSETSPQDDPFVATNIEFLELQRFRPVTNKRARNEPIIRAIKGHDYIQRSEEGVWYVPRLSSRETVNIQTADQLHELLGWAALKVGQAATVNTFMDATHYVEDPFRYT